jgi:putative methanogenesis marker 16 metalloprotein
VFKKTLTLDDFAFARIIITRGGFKNYTAFANPSDSVYTTIFSDTLGLAGNLTEASVSGCGEINPLENDHASRFIRNGATILINGAVGTVMGPGTRSSESKPNLSAFADMKGMDARMMGGFRTSRGPECLTSLATAIPVADLEALEAVSILDEDTVLPIADVHDRKPLFKGRYSQIWKGDNLDVTSDLDSCLHCGTCVADELCPLGASPSSGTEGNVLCMNCGLCVSTCVGGIFECDLGSIDYGGTNVPIKVRQSDRRRGEELCVRVKRLVEEGKWNLGNGQWESTP